MKRGSFQVSVMASESNPRRRSFVMHHSSSLLLSVLSRVSIASSIRLRARKTNHNLTHRTRYRSHHDRAPGVGWCLGQKRRLSSVQVSCSISPSLLIARLMQQDPQASESSMPVHPSTYS